MKCHIVLILLLIMTVESQHSTDDSFFISAPRLFHVGVNEKVFVQMGKRHLNNDVTLYLVDGSTGTVMSERKYVRCTDESQIKTVELKINRETLSRLDRKYDSNFELVAESPSFSKRMSTMVRSSKRRGYIFIQTDQPIYNPKQTVKYRIFSLDHTFRPHGEVIQISVFNAAGNRIMKSLMSAKGGLLRGIFPIPEAAKLGTWKITAHYQDDERKAFSRQFQVKKFVLPSFEVDIAMEQNYILWKAKENFIFTISAMYSHGDALNGSYHCQFGVVQKLGQKTAPKFIKGLELTGSVQNGIATVSLDRAKLNEQLRVQLKLALSDLQQRGEQLFLRVYVTNIQSGEMQQTEVSIPIISNKYTIDLSRTRSYFLPGYPLDVVVVMRLPDGSPAAGVNVSIHVPPSTEKYFQGITNQEGAVINVFNVQSAADFTLDVTVGDLQKSTIIRPVSSPSNSYLHISITSRVYSVNEFLSVTYHTVNAPITGFIYYMVLSRGILIDQGSHAIGISITHKLYIRPNMVPSFRLIGYFYNKHGDIITDSVWVDVRDECEINVKVQHKGPFEPGKKAQLEIDLHGQSAKVALLAVDKAFYALNVDNKFTAKQVFSTMQSYDLGCSYGGGHNQASVLTDAGLSFVSSKQSEWKRVLVRICNANVSFHVLLMSLSETNFTNEILQECCVQGFTPIPMRLSCKDRAERVSKVKKNQACTDAFLKCCLEGERLRQLKIQEDAQKGLGRTVSTEEIEYFFLEESQPVRRIFPPSFAFTEFDVNSKGRHTLQLPDSITTWEVQIVTLSAATGLCVVKPTEVRAFKRVFVSLRLPYSVKKYEQLYISPVVYNYDDKELQVAVHMTQTEGLCSPGSSTPAAFVNITLKPQSSQSVYFSAVPMVAGSIPIKIRVYDIENSMGIDAVEKMLNVKTEGLYQRDETTHLLKLDGSSTTNFTIDGALPHNTIPDSDANIFISMEGDGFANTYAKNLLSPEWVAKMIVLPSGCLEQTMSRLAPTALALRYLDLSQQWFNLPAGSRDEALNKLESNQNSGYMNIFRYKQPNGAYGAFGSVQSSNWGTAFVVKVLSMVAERQTAAVGQQARISRVVPAQEITHPVSYLLSVQKPDGSFTDPNPVLHKGILMDTDQDASMTAFITLALNRSLQFQTPEARNNVEAAISRSTEYLQSHFEELQHPYAVAIAAYCLSVCLPRGTDLSRVWTKLQTMATEGENGCYLWSADANTKNEKRPDAITIETTAYALLTAVALKNTDWANRAACWLTTKENYFGGYRSSQDTLMVLDALAEYELLRPISPEANIEAEFHVTGKKDIIKLALENKEERVETNLRKFTGNNIVAELTGQGHTKLKIVKAYHLLDPDDVCAKLSINVTVEGKVEYTVKIIENYDDYEDYENDEDKAKTRVERSPIEWFDSHTRNRRNINNSLNTDETVTYKVCVRHSLDTNLTGMAIADITLLSGFEAVTKDLDQLKELPEQYITHYEVSYGRVVIYFNELIDPEECISFDATQTVPVALLQPAPAVFYDYYEPDRKCTVFYSAPKRSKIVSKLCSEDVCQCAERPCHKLKMTFGSSEGKQKLKKDDRLQHACFYPTADYAYTVEVLGVSMKSNFELYETKVIGVLRSYGDKFVKENSIRVFAKRRHCKEKLDVGKQYLIMGKDGSTTDSNGMMQYLLESNTWLEKTPSDEQCQRSANQPACRGFSEFLNEYKLDGCKQ
uniref:Complement 4B (Chido blood group) n=1 Tax=Monopterus albus TaxID=43700 RepID=A0A3Q3II57_MONAL